MAFKTISFLLSSIGSENSLQKRGLSSSILKSLAKANHAQRPSSSQSCSEKPSRFFTAKLFSTKNVVQCSYDELSKVQGVTRRLSLGRSPVDEKATQKSKEKALIEKTLSTAIRTFFSAKEEKFAFEELKKVYPKWWLSNTTLLKKTLGLLKEKVSKGCRARSIPRWMSYTLQEERFGFRRKIARKWRQAISSQKSPFTSASPYIQTVFEHLCSFALKETDHLGIALRIYDKADKGRPIRNPNAFLNWLISFKEPFDFFNKKGVPILFENSLKEMDLLAVIKWTKKQLFSIKDPCAFIQKNKQPPDSDPDKFSVGLYSYWKEARVSSFFYETFPEKSLSKQEDTL